MNTLYIGGLDIGGTKMAATVASVSGPLARVAEPTIKTGPADAVGKQALALLEQACMRAGIESGLVEAVGVSSAGPFARRDGGIGLVTPNLCGALKASADLPNDWDFIPLESILRSRFKSIEIANDCVAALVGERTFGAVRGEADCVYVTWSTGIGFGLCVDGRILRGKHGNAGHAGHTLLNPLSDALCGCGNRGDVESLVSGRNLGNRLGRPAADVFGAARDGEPDAQAIAREAAQWFGRALYNVAATLDTRTFVVGGSVWNHHGDWLLPIVQHEIASRLPVLTEDVAVMPAALGTLVADVGALALVMPQEWMAEWQKTRPWQALAGLSASSSG